MTSDLKDPEQGQVSTTESTLPLTGRGRGVREESGPGVLVNHPGSEGGSPRTPATGDTGGSCRTEENPQRGQSCPRHPNLPESDKDTVGGNCRVFAITDSHFIPAEVSKKEESSQTPDQESVLAAGTRQ